MVSQYFTKQNLVIAIAVAMAFFHLYTASFGILPNYAQTSIHWGFVASIIFLLRPIAIKQLRIIDYLVIILNWYIVYYIINAQEELVIRAGSYTTEEMLLGVFLIIIGLEAGRRTIGYILTILVIAFILYAYFGSYIPGMFQTASFSVKRISTYLYTGSDGLFGQVLSVSAEFIFLFVLFGAVLNITGAGDFFVNLAYSVTGKISGGPAQAAITSSLLMGTINGSGAANVVTTGTFTIPLMKRVGFQPHYAGAVEAVSSSGGQIMPPVMGAVAFLMAEITSISYLNIIIASLVPALLYYITLSTSVYFNSKKQGFKGLSAEELPSFWGTLRSGWIYLTPLVALVVLLSYNYSPQKAAFYAIVLTFVIGFIKDRSKMTTSSILEAFSSAAQGIMPIATACLLAGGIMGIIQLTGLGIKISGILEALAGDSLLIALILTMLASLILGMGLPTSAAYLILAILIAPALISFGVSKMAAHLFILYFGALSTITPPVALSVFAAAGIAGSDVWKTGVSAVKLGIAGFIIPFIFIYDEALLLESSFFESILPILTTALGCVFLAMALMGWIFISLTMLYRLIFTMGSLLLFLPNNTLYNLLGLVLCMGLFFLCYSSYKKSVNFEVK